ncbi:MAG: rhodanese-like domain-containing protein [Bacteroidota bacterium]
MNEDITSQEVKDRIDKGESFNFIDVREEWEYEEANIGAKLIPLSELSKRVSDIAHMKDQEIVVHCKSGNRSNQAKKFLNSKGFSNVRNMLGGITEYQTL